MALIKGVLGILAIAFFGGVVMMYSGVIDVGATNPHSPLTEFVLSTTLDNSVRQHAKGIKAPPLDDPAMVMEGFRHYREMCVGCHLRPGLRSSEIRKGLLPEPPKLRDVVEEWHPNELFWIIKNGVKMTGMPAWGPTHSDEKIWAMVAFLEKLPDMDERQYLEMDEMAGHEADHHHDDEDDSDDHHDGSEHVH